MDMLLLATRGEFGRGGKRGNGERGLCGRTLHRTKRVVGWGRGERGVNFTVEIAFLSSTTLSQGYRIALFLFLLFFRKFSAFNSDSCLIAGLRPLPVL